ncbi:transposition regulatory protein TnpB [Bacillus cereus H3081.97]|uniref:tyrosine-type recombinase/integrase n=1 Tax=Bacillus paranthracis TaxID=2026186 RepID=UPI00016B8A60|nr:tyrosine-type recombinase/integrase [Bacillus paranthracis]EDZ57029.1 transposition regulatory protein TnpB [Bacillus cereus H3081.97]KLA04091.1 hypothetical protein B4086_3435 [Bacillus cereus]
MKQIRNTHKENLGFHEGLQRELSIYPQKTVHKDGSITIEQIYNPYFLVNDKWNISFFRKIKQFEKTIADYNCSSRNIHFRFTNPTINLEVKFVFYQYLFNDFWSLKHSFQGQDPLKRMTDFLNEKYPKLSSLLDLDIEKTEQEYLFWLNEQGVKTHRKQTFIIRGSHIYKTNVFSYLRTIYTSFLRLTDKREEWEKDKWDVRILHDKHGIDYNKSKSSYYLDFSKTDKKFREEVKKYFKQRLLSKNKFSWGTAQNYLGTLSTFFTFIFRIEPLWENLEHLNRTHIERYIEHIHDHSNNSKRPDSHPERYVNSTLSIIQKFLEDIQRYEYEMAPKNHIRLLIFPEDRPKLRKKPRDHINYIPDYVLEQLFTHIDDLHKDVIPVIWIAFKTGHRISDILGLTTNCLVQLNGQYSIETDIEKTYVKGHRIPIDEELAKIIAVLIAKSKENSNQDNNPEGYIFIRYRGQRKGKPFTQAFVREQLNILALQKNITDESGNLFRFKPHQFRHTYGVKMLNGGADILTVQELLAHASPEMTLRYAKLLDDTKRKAFELVMKEGVFTFDLNGEVQEIKAGEDIPTDILNALWQDQKLNAMDNPYGTCHARLKGNCPHMEAPPCLTCNGGNPCKDLAIGFSELDIQKYELHIKTTAKAIEVAKQYGREDIAEKHARNLKRYEGILNNIQEGNVIFGRQERVKRKQGLSND